jgi:hypothetical protein
MHTVSNVLKNAVFWDVTPCGITRAEEVIESDETTDRGNENSKI